MSLMAENKERSIEFMQIKGQDRMDEIKQLFLEYAKSLNIDLAFQDFTEELRALPGKYAPPDGALLLVVVDGKAAACIALRRIAEGICEMKRLYVREEFRGLGIGKRLITRILEEASKLEYRYIRLDTLPTMKKAQELYQSFGFYEIPPYVYNPIKGTRYMELNLRD